MPISQERFDNFDSELHHLNLQGCRTNKDYEKCRHQLVVLGFQLLDIIHDQVSVISDVDARREVALILQSAKDKTPGEINRAKAKAASYHRTVTGSTMNDAMQYVADVLRIIMERNMTIRPAKKKRKVTKVKFKKPRLRHRTPPKAKSK
jgi:hypothetical protein